MPCFFSNSSAPPPNLPHRGGGNVFLPPLVGGVRGGGGTVTFFISSKIFKSSCNCVRRLLLGFSQDGIIFSTLLIKGSIKEKTFNLLSVFTVRESNGIVNPDNRLANSLRDSMSVRLSTHFQVFA